MNKYIEMWKIERIIGWLDVLFDTCFLAFLWVMQWNQFFWIYLVIAILSIIGHGISINTLENKIK